MTRDREFEDHAVRLDEPIAAAVREAFETLPRRGSLTCLCRWERRLELLDTLEACGAFAIRFEPVEGFVRVGLAALKGKSGPCYDTGRRAVYRGDAAAVLDDDGHLIAGGIRVCEKTGGFYMLAPYCGALRVTEADPALLARLDSDPVPFDCNTFDADSRRLADALADVRGPAADVAVVYPGPFRALVLSDGSVVRRGVAALVTSAQAGKNGLLRLPAALAGEARPCEPYAAASRVRGPAFMLAPLRSEPPAFAAGFPAVAALDARALDALRGAPADVKRRLLRLIDEREPYWVLTGSDPDVAGGCCPSTTVGAANRLAAAGALQSHLPPAPPDACTVTFYAFPGEIGCPGPEAEPAFRLLDGVRSQAAEALRGERFAGAAAGEGGVAAGAGQALAN